MSREEKILLGLAIAALAAIVIFQRGSMSRDPGGGGEPVAADTSPVIQVGDSFTPANSSMTKGPAYLTYNAPFMFAPPISNFLPSITAGQGSQTVNQPTDFVDLETAATCGCA